MSDPDPQDRRRLPEAYVARDQEHYIVRALTDTLSRTVLIEGPAGTGKSTLSHAISQRYADAFPGGVCHLQPTDYDSTGLTLSRLQSALTSTITSDAPSLLVLDDFISVSDHSTEL